MVDGLDAGLLDDPRAVTVVETLRALKEANHLLSIAIAGDAAFVPPPLQFRLARGEGVDFSVHISNMLSLGFDESGSVTRNPYGLIVVSPSCLDAAKRVNDAKDAFANACRAFLKSRFYPTAREQLSTLFQSERMFTISLRQAYRHLIVCDMPISKIGFTLARKGRSITTFSPEKAIAHLVYRFGDEHAARIQSIVDLFVNSGAPLYRVWNAEPRLSANITFEDGSTKMIHAHSLVLAPYGKHPTLSNVNSDKDWDILFAERIRATRKDRIISSIPIIPKTTIHSTIDFDHLCTTVPFAEPKGKASEDEQ
jgi:hypothetical protein